MKNLWRKHICAILSIAIILSLAGCGSMMESQKAINLLQKSTIYYTGDQQTAIDTLSNKGLYIDKKDEAQSEFIKYNTHISIKDSGGLGITVDNKVHILEVTCDSIEKLNDVYGTIIRYIESGDRHDMYPGVIFENGKVKNITMDKDSKTITFDFSEYGVVDTRLLEIYLTEYNKYRGASKSELKLGNVTDNTNLFVFKPDGIYGISNTAVGTELIGRLDHAYNDSIISIDNRIYKGVNVDSVIETVQSIIPFEKTAELVVSELIDSVGDAEEIKVHFTDEVAEYKNDLIDIFKSVGYNVIEEETRAYSDIVIGYTLFNNSNNQTIIENRLLDRIMNHSNCSTIIDKDVNILFRTAWGMN